MIIVFDLDNTLFDETDFIKSGFRAVCHFMKEKWQIPEQEALETMTQILAEKGRGHVFDGALKKYGYYSKTNVSKCLAIYRSHKPNISLYSDAERCLRRLKIFPLYIVTDGNKIVQNNKIKALGLLDIVKKAIITYRYGIKNSKPSPYCFFKIAKWEKVGYEEIVYIGDNPSKDFIGLKPLGFKTLRLRRGEHKDVKITPQHEAHRDIYSLDELTPELIKELETNA